MRLLTRSGRAAWLAAPALVLALAGCSMFGGGGEPETTATTGNAQANSSGAPAEGELDVRRYLGPDYCPEIRIPDGFEVLRRLFGRGRCLCRTRQDGRGFCRDKSRRNVDIGRAHPITSISACSAPAALIACRMEMTSRGPTPRAFSPSTTC